jgi:hypothetical protein
LFPEGWALFGLTSAYPVARYPRSACRATAFNSRLVWASSPVLFQALVGRLFPRVLSAPGSSPGCPLGIICCPRHCQFSVDHAIGETGLCPEASGRRVVHQRQLWTVPMSSPSGLDEAELRVEVVLVAGMVRIGTDNEPGDLARIGTGNDGPGF